MRALRWTLLASWCHGPRALRTHRGVVAVFRHRPHPSCAIGLGRYL